ncbi:hypothetical protein C7212DRAFT_311409, partial [Tuber magnatum]
MCPDKMRPRTLPFGSHTSGCKCVLGSSAKKYITSDALVLHLNLGPIFFFYILGCSASCAIC